MQVNKTNNLTFRQKYEFIPPKIIAEKLKKHYTYGQIADEYNVTENAVFRSVKNRIVSSTEEERKRIYKLYLNKYSFDKIKSMLGFPIQYIKKVIKQYETEQPLNPNSNNLINSIINKFNLDSNVMKNLK